jgi:hypothetical protein
MPLGAGRGQLPDDRAEPALAQVHIRLGQVGARNLQVIVEGVVDGVEQRRRALHLVESLLPDGGSVEDQLRVRSPPPARPGR